MYKYEMTEKGSYKGIEQLERSVVLIVEDINDKDEIESKLNVVGEGKLIFIENEKDRYKELDEKMRDSSNRNKIRELVNEQIELDFNKIRDIRLKNSFKQDKIVEEIFETLGMINEETTRTLEDMVQNNIANPLEELEKLMLTAYSELGDEGMEKLDQIINKITDITKIIIYSEASKLDEDISRNMADITVDNEKDDTLLVILETKESYENLHPSIKSRCDLIENGELYSVRYLA